MTTTCVWNYSLALMSASLFLIILTFARSILSKSSPFFFRTKFLVLTTSISCGCSESTIVPSPKGTKTLSSICILSCSINVTSPSLVNTILSVSNCIGNCIILLSSGSDLIIFSKSLLSSTTIFSKSLSSSDSGSDFMKPSPGFDVTNSMSLSWSKSGFDISKSMSLSCKGAKVQ